MRYTDMNSKVNKISLSQLYERTIYVMVTAMPPQIWTYPKPSLIFAFDDIYYYYLGDDVYEIPKYL